MKIQLVKQNELFWIKTVSYKEAVEREVDEDDIAYTNRAFKKFEEYVSAREKLKQQGTEEIIKTVTI